MKKALQDFSADGRAIGAVGIFDRRTAQEAVTIAKSINFPLVLLTLSDAPLCEGCPTWRALHTPLLVARTAVGMSMSRNSKRVLIARPANGYGKTHGHWIRKVVDASGGQVVDEIVWNAKKPNWSATANAIKANDFDTLYLPTNHLAAAQLLRHLAAIGIWARGEKPRFAASEKMREITIIGTPEWYRPEFVRLAGRYGVNTLVPVAYAAETQRGASLAQRLKNHAGTHTTAMDALIEDVLLGFAAANKIAVDQKTTVSQALKSVTVDNGFTAGLNFARQDALSALIVLELTATGFQPYQAE